MLPRSVPDSCLFETNPIPEQHSLVWIFSWTDKMLFVFLSGDWSVRRFHTGDHFRGLQWRVSLPSVTSSSSPLSPCSVPPSHSAKVLPLPPCRPVTTMTTRRAESKVRDTRPTVAHSCPAGGPFPPFLSFFFFLSSIWMQGATCSAHIPANLHGNSHLAASGDAARVRVHRMFNQCPWIRHMAAAALQGCEHVRKLTEEGCFFFIFPSVSVCEDGRKRNVHRVTWLLQHRHSSRC